MRAEVAGQNYRQRNPLPSRFGQGKEERKSVAKTDLRKGIFKREIGDGSSGRAQKDSQRDEEQALRQT